MRVVVFHPDSQRAAWSLCDGLVNTIARAKHQVVDVAITPQQLTSESVAELKALMPKLSDLAKADAIIISGPEHLTPYLEAVYGAENWKTLKAKARCANWLHESMFREDTTIDFEKQMRPWADENFCPAIQDVDFLDQEQFAAGHVHWLPFGVDTQIFKLSKAVVQETGTIGSLAFRGKIVQARRFPISIIGMMYEKRQRYMRQLTNHLVAAGVQSIQLATSIKVEDIDGYNHLESVTKLADAYRATKVLFNLPALSQLCVSKITEAVACGALVITPNLVGGAAENETQFIDKKHLLYYKSAHMGFTAQMLARWSSEGAAVEREQIAREGAEYVAREHSLERKLDVIFAKLGLADKWAPQSILTGVAK